MKSSPVPGQAQKKNVIKTNEKESSTSIFEKEWDEYLTMPIIPRTDSPFIWWHQYKLRFLLLHEQAVHYFSAPASSVFRGWKHMSTKKKSVRAWENRSPQISPPQFEKTRFWLLVSGYFFLLLSIYILFVFYFLC